MYAKSYMKNAIREEVYPNQVGSRKMGSKTTQNRRLTISKCHAKSGFVNYWFMLNSSYRIQTLKFKPVYGSSFCTVHVISKGKNDLQ